MLTQNQITNAQRMAKRLFNESVKRVDDSRNRLQWEGLAKDERVGLTQICGRLLSNGLKYYEDQEGIIRIDTLLNAYII